MPIKITILPSTADLIPTVEMVEVTPQQDQGIVVSLTPVLAGDQSFSLAPGDMEIQAILANASSELSIAEVHVISVVYSCGALLI